MKYDPQNHKIIINRNLNELDKFALDFTKILQKHVDYVIISGYISILLGRARATEDIDMFIKPLSKEKFSQLYQDLLKNGFWCLNAEKTEEVFNYLNQELAIRFSRKNQAIPNFEVKFSKNQIEEETFTDAITAILPLGKLKISSLERQIAFKRYYLQSDKDIEDALHIEELFKEQLDYGKINKLKKQIEKIKQREHDNLS